MREFLILSPLNIIFSSLIVIVVISSWLVSQCLLKFQLNSVGLSSWFSPSMIVLKEHIVQVQVVSK